MTTITTIDGKAEVTIGQTFIGFKDDIEQTGRLVEVRGSDLVLSVYDSESGDRYEVTKSASRCWVEG